jgi:ankyrin repeat protein
MSVRPLPERPNLDQLRRLAKELRDAARRGEPDALERLSSRARVEPGGSVTLALAQLTIAREHGFPSWPALKAEVEVRTMGLDQLATAFLAASVEGRPVLAARLLERDPRLAMLDVRCAAVLGEAGYVRDLIARSLAAAVQPDALRSWPPLLYVCHSCWHRIDPARGEGMVDVARLLLDAGASPDSTNGRPARHGYRSALYAAAGIANNPVLTRLLLERGANPDDDESVYHSVFHPDHACLRLLVEHGARVEGTNALGASIGGGDVEAVRMLLAAGAVPRHLALAAARDSRAVVEALLAAGADASEPNREGRSPLREAVRRGKLDVAGALVGHGAADDSTDIDRLLGACARADRAEAERLLRRDPTLPGGLSDDDCGALVDVAEHGPAAAVELMLDLGFPVGAHRPDDGGTALHAAAYEGRMDMVRLLVARGADVNARDRQWHSTALCWASVGSGERHSSGPDADWPATIRALLDAGSSLDGAWVAGKPPSEEVAEQLLGLGVTGEEQAEPDDEEDDASAADPVVVADLARRLRAALTTRDPDLLAPLLDPDVRWGWGPGSCRNRDQVLAHYAAVRDRGVRAEVVDVRPARGAIEVDLTVSGGDRRAETVRQRFVVTEGAITEIREM